MSEPAQSSARRAYYVGFVAVVVGCFTPFKAITHLFPMLFVLWMVVRAPESVHSRRFGVVLGSLVILGMTYQFVLAPEFLPANYLLAILTYSSVLPLVLVDGHSVASPELFERQLKACAVVIGVQGAVGMVQAIYGFTQTGTFGGANGDIVQGTIYPHLAPEMRFSNPMFAVNMTMMLLACASSPRLFTGHNLIAIALGAIALVLASVVHVLVFLAGALIIAFVLVRPRRKVRKRGRTDLILAVVLMGGLSYVVLGENVEQITYVAEKAVDLDAVDIPRAVLLARVLQELPEEAPLQPFVGLGPGQFSSRASLIASGLYLGGPSEPRTVPFVTPKATRLADDYCFTLLIAFSESELVIGSSQQPFFSFLSVYTELGVVGLVALLWPVVVVIRRCQRRVQLRPDLQLHGLAFCAATLFLLFIGLQDNYWESPQSILVGLLLLKVMYANIMACEGP